MSTSLSRSPGVINCVTWSTAKGAKWWGRVGIHSGDRGRGLFCTQPIPQYDFALAVPLEATFSFLNFEKDTDFPLRVSPADFGETLPWWPDLDWGTFSLMMWMTAGYIKNDPRVAHYMAALPRPQQNEQFSSSFVVLNSIASQAMRSREYLEVSSPVAAQCRVPPEMFDFNLAWMYTMIRSRSVPLWSRHGGGHSYFSTTVYAEESSSSPNSRGGGGGGGDVSCLVPMLDFVNHSHEPNATVGFPDEEMVSFLMKERGMTSPHMFVLQTQRDLAPGDELLVDYNINYGFDPEMFSVWFDTPLKDPVTEMGNNQRVDDGDAVPRADVVEDPNSRRLRRQRAKEMTEARKHVTTIPSTPDVDDLSDEQLDKMLNESFSN
eukprot:PhM_4_TR4575/c0_g1_i1/m.16329